MEINNCRLIGTIIKTHGFNGGVLLGLTDLLPDNIIQWELIFIEIDGLLVPFFILEDSINIHSNKTVFLRIEDIENKKQAQEFINSKVYIQKELVEDTDVIESKYQNILNFIVTDIKHGIIGKVNSIIEIPDNPVMQIMREETEILVPLNDAIITNIDDNKRLIEIEAPDGLIDIYL